MSTLETLLNQVKISVADQNKEQLLSDLDEAKDFINAILNHPQFKDASWDIRFPIKNIRETSNDDPNFMAFKTSLETILYGESTATTCEQLVLLDLVFSSLENKVRPELSSTFASLVHEVRRKLQLNESTSDYLLDMRFFSPQKDNADQSVLGKAPKEGKSFLKGVIPMKAPFWTDGSEIFLSKDWKKAKKVSVSESTQKLTCDAYPELRGNYLYIISPKGSLYIQDESISRRFRHSGFRAGQPVFCAGKLTIENGKITQISNASGHYHPAYENLIKTCIILNEKNMLTETCRIVDNQGIPDTSFIALMNNPQYSELIGTFQETRGVINNFKSTRAEWQKLRPTEPEQQPEPESDTTQNPKK